MCDGAASVAVCSLCWGVVCCFFGEFFFENSADCDSGFVTSQTTIWYILVHLKVVSLYLRPPCGQLSDLKKGEGENNR